MKRSDVSDVCVCVCVCQVHAASQLQMWRISAVRHIVYAVSQLQNQTRLRRSGAGPINQAHFNWIHRFWKTTFSFFFAAVKLKHDCVCLYLFLITQSSLSYVLHRPATAKHFTSCWCQGRSLYLFLSPQKSGPAPVFMIKLWLLGRHLDSSVIDDGC